MGSKELLSTFGVKVVPTKDIYEDREESVKDGGFKLSVPTIRINKGDIMAAVKAGLVPEVYKDCEFDIEKIKENQKNQYQTFARKFKIRRFEDYSGVTMGILSTIISNMLPTQSYVIGAPNGFGKTSFVNTCILKLYAQGRMCTPYISLSELAQIKLENEQRLLKGITSNKYYGQGNDIYASLGEEYDKLVYSGIEDELYVKKPINIVDRFSWSEYINSDVLFCYFTDVRAKAIESEMLKTLLTIRGAKGLPTIAMISTSLSPYKDDRYLAEYVWNEILTYNSKPSYDRVTHVSCYKDYKAPLIKSNIQEERFSGEVK